MLLSKEGSSLPTYFWNLWVSTGSRCLMSALPVKMPSRYTQRRCTSIQTSNRAMMRFSLSSQLRASSSNTWEMERGRRNDHVVIV